MYPDISNSPKVTLIKTLKETIQFPNVNSNNIQRDHYCFQSPGEKWGFPRNEIAFDILAVAAKGFSMLKEAVSVGKGFVRVKLKVYACYAWVQGRQKWCRKTGIFNVVWFWRACFRALIMIRQLYRGWDSRCVNRRRGPAAVSPHSYPPHPTVLPATGVRGRPPQLEAAGFRIPFQVERPIQLLDILLLQTSTFYRQ